MVFHFGYFKSVGDFAKLLSVILTVHRFSFLKILSEQGDNNLSIDAKVVQRSLTWLDVFCPLRTHTQESGDSLQPPRRGSVYEQFHSGDC